LNGIGGEVFEILTTLLAESERLTEASGDLGNLGSSGGFDFQQQGAKVIDRKISRGQEGLQFITLVAESCPADFVGSIQCSDIKNFRTHKKSDLGVHQRLNTLHGGAGGFGRSGEVGCTFSDLCDRAGGGRQLI
jgi:hypothetical protein